MRKRTVLLAGVALALAAIGLIGLGGDDLHEPLGQASRSSATVPAAERQEPERTRGFEGTFVLAAGERRELVLPAGP